jgi:hypothetical protein
MWPQAKKLLSVDPLEADSPRAGAGAVSGKKYPWKEVRPPKGAPAR